MDSRQRVKLIAGAAVVVLLLIVVVVVNTGGGAADPEAAAIATPEQQAETQKQAEAQFVDSAGKPIEPESIKSAPSRLGGGK